MLSDEHIAHFPPSILASPTASEFQIILCKGLVPSFCFGFIFSFYIERKNPSLDFDRNLSVLSPMRITPANAFIILRLRFLIC